MAVVLCALILRAGAAAALETDAGDRAADALRASAGTQFALISENALAAGEEAPVVTALSAAQLRDLLEQAVAGIVVDPATERIDEARSDTGAFVQVSGFTFRYDASALPGERVLSVRVGEETLDLTDTAAVYTAALSADLAAGKPMDAPLREIIADAPAREDEGKRITTIGARENLIAERLPVGLLPVGCAIAAAVAVFYTKKLRRRSNVVLSETGIYGGISE